MPLKEFRAGDILFRAGDPSDSAYLIESGHVEIIRGQGADATQIAVLGPGEIFGEMALVEDRPHTLTARATSNGEATSMTRPEFEDSILHDPARARKYLRGVFERLRDLMAYQEEQAPPADSGPLATMSTKMTLYPLTRKAADTLPDEGLPITQLPFRIGRAAEAREREALDLNDLWLLDSEPMQVSRNHLSIDSWDGQYFVVRDRGSKLGTIVNQHLIGGNSKSSVAPLSVGDNVIVVGSPVSPYQFRLRVEAAEPPR